MGTRSTAVRVALPALVALIAVTVAGCGGGAGGRDRVVPALPRQAARATALPALPVGWRRPGLPSGPVLPYPASWRPVGGDPGSASAALFDANGTIRAYLN